MDISSVYPVFVASIGAGPKPAIDRVHNDPDRKRERPVW